MDAHQPPPEWEHPPHAGPPDLAGSQSRSASPDPAAAGASDADLEALRDLLARPDRAQAATVAARLAALEHRTSDPSELVAALSPLMGDIIRRKIQDSREEMIEALYPIIGQLISRAVAEAIRDLARAIDTRMRVSFGPGLAWRRWRARLAGIPDAALTLRDALPFQVAELFVVHRESGLLLTHLSNDTGSDEQADLISGMLTAIRDFAQDAFGRGQEGQLDEIQYGARRILIEASRHAYLAVVVEGIEPHGFREAMRQRIVAIENTYASALVRYDGDATRFEAVEPDLVALLRSSSVDRPGAAAGLSLGQRRIMVGLAAVLVLCLLAACVGGFWVVRNALNQPVTTVVVVVSATPEPTSLPTATAQLTHTPTASTAPTGTYTATPTATPMPTARLTRTPTPQPSPVAYVFDQPVNIRSRPGPTCDVLETAAGRREFAVIGRNAMGSWWRVCCTGNGASGCVASALAQIEGNLSGVPVLAAD